MFLAILECSFIYGKLWHYFESSLTFKYVIVEIPKVYAITAVISVFTTHLSPATNDVAAIARTIFVLDFLHIKTIKEIIISKNSIIHSITIYLMNLAAAFEIFKFITCDSMLLSIFKSSKAVSFAIHFVNI